MTNSRKRNLEARVIEAAERVYAEQQSVSPVDVCQAIGWLHSNHVHSWQRGQADSLDKLFGSIAPDKLAELVEYLQRWAQAKGLSRQQAEYLSATRHRRPLRFFSSADADPEPEAAWHYRWDAPDITKRRKEKLTAAPDLVVVMPVKDWICAECEDTGAFLIMDDSGPLCLTCADMDHLEFLPSGDAALTRRAKKASGLSAVVVRWSRSRKRYERQGILAEPAAIIGAEQQCLADAEIRERRRERDRVRREAGDVDFQARFATEIRALFPGCPPDRAEAIAQHAGMGGSGRVGRSAAGQSLDQDAVTLAVIASIRHADTNYDDLLMSGVPRAEAREAIARDIDQVLERFRREPYRSSEQPLR